MTVTHEPALGRVLPSAITRRALAVQIGKYDSVQHRPPRPLQASDIIADSTVGPIGRRASKALSATQWPSAQIDLSANSEGKLDNISDLRVRILVSMGKHQAVKYR